jgi:hypothetical protein
MNPVLFLLPALAIGALGWLVRRRAAAVGQTMIALGCLGCLGVIGFQLRQTVFPSPVVSLNRVQMIVSYYFGSQAMRELPGRPPGPIVLIFPPEGALDARSVESYVNTFRPTLGVLHDVQELQPVRLEAPAKAARNGDIPLSAFQQVVAKFPNAAVFVSYAGVPADFEKLFPADKPVPPFLAFDPWRTTRWVTPLKNGKLRAVIVPRPDVDLASKGDVGGDPGSIFNQLYLMAVPATAEQVAAKLAAK